MKNNTLLIGIVVLLLLSNLFFGYMFFFHSNDPRQGVRGDFPQMELSDAQIQSVTSFFEGTTDINEITTYCDNQENRMLCFYYCRQIDSDHEYCSQLTQRMPDSQQVQKLN
ncbi:MAG: hypothetical protein KKB31_05065 [Nanoarchaeota archaeon]|nr:hypothetical protein [Nanoarchaeota archaeon]